MVIQPENRGTVPAILYSLLRLTTMVSRGPVAIFPSDHYVFEGPPGSKAPASRIAARAFFSTSIEIAAIL